MRLDQKTKINRLVIYFFYDADGIVDRYVPYMLEDIVKKVYRGDGVVLTANAKKQAQQLGGTGCVPKADPQYSRSREQGV